VGIPAADALARIPAAIILVLDIDFAGRAQLLGSSR